MSESDGKKAEEIARIVRQVEAALRKELSDLPGTLDDIEHESQKIGEQVKAIIERERLKSKGGGYQGKHTACSCGYLARYRSDYVRRITTQSGVRRIARAYYYCDHCHQGFCPLDADLSLVPGEFSVRVRGLAARFSGYVPYEAASQELREVLGVFVSASSIRRISLSVGRQIQSDFDRQQALLAADECGFNSDRRPKRLHCSMDGCMILVGDQWREVKTGVVYQRRGDEGVACADYYSTLSESHVFGPKVRTLAYLNGADRCQDLAMLGDGAKWIWQETSKGLPRAVQILDLYHVMEYVWAIGKARWGEKSQEGAAWASESKALLLEDRVADVIESIAAWKPETQECEDLKRTTVGYFIEHKDRMLYKTFLAQGWHIGSGVMESANNAVIQHRLKRPGMRWEQVGAEAMLKIRTAIASSRKVDFKDLATRAAVIA